MPKITFEGKSYECRPDETVLEGLERQGVMLPSSCRAGACQSCLMRAVAGTPSRESQQGLKDTLQAQGYFLACLCKPGEDMEIALAQVSEKRTAKVLEKTVMNANVVRLRLARDGFDYIPGQFINVTREQDGLTRSYSLASVLDEDFLELHVKRVPDGRMSPWLCDEVSEGDALTYYGPAGDCFYVPGEPDRNLILAGTGTGLAPLYGIVRHALSLGHRGRIFLFHGSLAAEGLYMVDELRDLAAKHESLQYIPCVLYGEPPAAGKHGAIDEVVVQTTREYMSGSRAYLCGDPPLVEAMRKKLFLAGISTRDIYADAFTFAP